MNKIETGVVLMATVLFMSCGGNDNPEIDKSIIPAPDSMKAANMPATVPANSAVPAGLTQAPVVTQSVPNPQVVSSAQTIPATQASKAMPGAGLNPAHGQPGHDCAIPVGAPLNSAPTAGAKPSVQTMSAPAITAPVGSPLAADPNAKLNPAHGQPGHDCAIPVGAPLKKS